MSAQCAFLGCDNPARSRGGLCRMHYQRKRRGQALSGPTRRFYTDAEISEWRPEITRRRRAGEPVGSIADDFPPSEQTIRDWLKAWNVTPETVASIPHGTPSGFNYHKCKCDVCMTAQREYKRRQREKLHAKDRTFPHGTADAYWQGCRCDACRNSLAEHMKHQNDASRPHARHHRQQWTTWEAEIAWDQRFTARQVAERIGRTIESVRAFRRNYAKRPDDPFGVKH